ncbi:unnamed protein product, partial [Ascophyllum nodosum]
ERSSVGPRERGVYTVGEALHSGRKLDGTFHPRRAECAASTPDQRQLGRDNLRNVIELKRSGGKKTRRKRANQWRISDRVAVHFSVYVEHWRVLWRTR